MIKFFCTKHSAYAYNKKYDSCFCPICYDWLEDYCDCTIEHKENGECHTPITRPKNAEGLENDL